MEGTSTTKSFSGEQSLSEPSIRVSLTHDPLDASAAMSRVKSPKAGAVVLFAGMPFHCTFPRYQLTEP